MSRNHSPTVIGRQAVIATEHYLSAAAGARIFARGGNAIDAAVAATFVEGVVNPHMHTLGGEAPMLIRPGAGRPVVSINGNTAAPAQATLEHYRSLGLKEIPGEGLLAAGAPAALDALLMVLEQFGTMPLEPVLEPALELCEEGFPLHVGVTGSPDVATTVAGSAATLVANAERFRHEWPSTGALYMPGGKVPLPDTMINNPALANCFRRLLEAASAAGSDRAAGLRAARARFYRGDIARQIADWAQSQGGLLRAEDLAAFHTRIEEPVSIDYHGIRVCKCGPWSQGPVFLQQLRLLEGFDLPALGHNSADYIHTVVEAAKLAFADRNAYYGDPQMVDVPMEALLTPGYAALRRGLIDPRHALRELARPGEPRAMRALAEQAGEGRGWGRGTVHVAAADRAGNLIAITPSGAWIPSSPVIPELGFPLGTRLQTFVLQAGHPNAPAPGKRPRTTLSPSLALFDDRRGLAFGTMGGDNQDQWTLQFFLNLVDFKMDLQAAIEAPRFSTLHFASSFSPHAALPGVVLAEERIAPEVVGELRRRGHSIELVPAYSEGYVLAVSQALDEGRLAGGADPRGHLKAVFPAYVIGW